MKSFAPPPVTPRRNGPPFLGAAVLFASAVPALPARLPARTTPPVAARSSRREGPRPPPPRGSSNGCCAIPGSFLSLRTDDLRVHIVNNALGERIRAPMLGAWRSPVQGG